MLRQIIACIIWGLLFNIGAHYAELTERQFWWMLGTPIICDLFYTLIKKD